MSAAPIRTGVLAGLLLAMILAIPAIAACYDLAEARGEVAALRQRLAEPHPVLPPLVRGEAVLKAEDLSRAQDDLARTIRDRARHQGLLVESIAPQALPLDGLAAVTFSVSGPEKGVLTVADQLEGDRPVGRFDTVTLESLPDASLRLSGTLVVPWRP